MNLNLKLKRVSKGLTQSELAEQAGISLFTYQQIETGKGNPRADTVIKISKALDIPVEVVLGEDATLNEDP